MQGIIFKELQQYQSIAIKYAKDRVEELIKDKAEIICRDSNPVTTVYELFEFLNSKRA